MKYENWINLLQVCRPCAKEIRLVAGDAPVECPSCGEESIIVRAVEELVEEKIDAAWSIRFLYSDFAIDMLHIFMIFQIVNILECTDKYCKHKNCLSVERIFTTFTFMRKVSPTPILAVYPPRSVRLSKYLCWANLRKCFGGIISTHISRSWPVFDQTKRSLGWGRERNSVRKKESGGREIIGKA